MSNRDLVFDIVLDNAEAFQNINAHQTMNILLTTKRACKINHIIETCKKYAAKKQARAMFFETYELFRTASYYLQGITTYGGIETHEHAIQKIKENVEKMRAACETNKELKNCLEMLIMAEYKENLFCIMYCVWKEHKMSIVSMQLFEEYFIYTLAICDLNTHMHDHSHYVFDDDDKEFYDFHTIEKQLNKSIVRIYYDGDEVYEDNEAFEVGDPNDD